MRSFSAFYFFLRVLIFIIDYFSKTKRFLPGYWSIYTLLFLTLALLIALIRPYKKTYMNVFDTISLASFAVVCHLMTLQLLFPTYHIISIGIASIALIPGLLLAFLLYWKAATKCIIRRQKLMKEQLITCFRWCRRPLSCIIICAVNYYKSQSLPQPMIRTTSYLG